MKKIIQLIVSAITTISNGVITLFKLLFKGIIAIVQAIYSGIAAIFKGIYSISKKIYTQCLPTYSVVFTMYHVIPGVPVQKNDSVHRFEKGAAKEAAAFFEKVVQTTKNNRIAPTEIKLKKGRKVVQIQQFGPINEILKFKIAA